MGISTQNRVVITAVEVLSPLGGNALQTCAAIKAGVTAFTEYPYYSCTPKDPEWEERLPVYAAMVPAIHAAHTGLERFMQLAIPTLAGLLEKAKLTRSSLAKTGLFVALPQLDASTQPLRLHSDLLPLFCKRTGLNVKAANVSLEGRVGIFSQFRNAIPLLQAGELDQCIVGGVDSYIMNDRLSFLDEHWRLKSARNVDGFIPGEAAAMLMLETEQHAQARGAVPLAVLGGTGAGVEPEALASDKVSTGQGLTKAIREAQETQAEQYQIENLYCDFNGESYYAFELGLLMSRMAPVFEAANGVCHPADCYGDIGSASGGVLTAYALDNFQKQGKKAKSALLWTSADSGNRMAVLLEPVLSG
jgi:3-oxoacyl-[acyl-carrier-protein] synthase I